MKKSEILIIGAGLIGSAVAYQLARLGAKNIRVLDFDLEGTLSSSELNAGGVRATWNQPINIGMSRLSIEYFASVAEQVGYRPVGYLWMHRPEQMDAALRAAQKQNQLGWTVETWDVQELKKRISFIDKTGDLAGAVFAPRDGLLNPNLLKLHYRDQARKLGVTFEDRRLVKSAQITATGVELECETFAPVVIHESKLEVLGSEFSKRPIEMEVGREKYIADQVVNCAGPWAPQIAQILGYACPSRPVRRQISIFDCREVDLTAYGMMIDPSGVYFHPEAVNGLSGFADREQAPGVDFTYDGERFFQEKIWPALYERSSKFERLRHLTGWAGLYEVSPDESAIIGEAGRAGPRRIFEAHSFSGHGAMHSFGAGLALAELIVNAEFSTLDASELNGRRFEKGKLVRESFVI